MYLDFIELHIGSRNQQNGMRLTASSCALHGATYAYKGRRLPGNWSMRQMEVWPRM